MRETDDQLQVLRFDLPFQDLLRLQTVWDVRTQTRLSAEQTAHHVGERQAHPVGFLVADALAGCLVYTFLQYLQSGLTNRPFVSPSGSCGVS